MLGHKFIATGNTYPHRERFMSWGWYWVASRGAWETDPGAWEDDDGPIKWANSLPGVTVRKERVR